MGFHQVPRQRLRRVSDALRGQETADRSKDTLLFASDQSLSYLTGALPADYGFDPLGLLDPEGKGAGFVSPAWLQYSEVIHARCSFTLSFTVYCQQ